MRKVLAGMLVAALSIQVLTAGNIVYAAEMNCSDENITDIVLSETDNADAIDKNSNIVEKLASDEDDVPEIVYPEDWDEEDPLNRRAYEQLYGSAESAAYLVEPTSRSAGITTWKGKTYTHCDYNLVDREPMVGIDVSYHQGEIDWKKVKEDGIRFAIIRVGYRAYVSGSIGLDSKFKRYITDAKASGIKVGVYFFSQAISEKEAVQEADFVLKNISGYDLDLPVVFDYEYAGEELGRLYEAHLNKTQKTENALAFCRTIENAGYSAMVYANSSWCYEEWDTPAIREEYAVWMARYASYSYNPKYDAGKARYAGQIDFWQCTDSAVVNGISTNMVDLDYWYMDIKSEEPEEPEEGWVQKGEDGNWYYYRNGVVDDSYTGLGQNEYGWWKIEDGKVNFGFTGLIKDQEVWVYIRGGQAILDYTGLAKNEYGWWRIEDGKVNFNFNGLAQNEYGWWYLRGGQVIFDYTGLAQNEYGWWRIGNGKVDFGFTGLAQNEYGWWRIENGKINFGYTGLAKNEYGWWRIENGKVNFSYNGMAENEYGWWYIRGGKVNFDYTGWTTVKSGRYWVQNGKVDR